LFLSDLRNGRSGVVSGHRITQKTSLWGENRKDSTKMTNNSP